MRLRIDQDAVARARRLAGAIVDPIAEFIAGHSTLSVERAVVRLCGVDGVDGDGIPLPNRLVDALAARELGAARTLGAAVAESGRTPRQIADAVVAGEALPDPRGTPESAARAALRPYVDAGLARIDGNRAARDAMLARLPQGEPPLLYVIVASGNIYEDRTAAVAAAEAGAQIVAVIRSTAQSLLDYVPYGATTEGFGGTYATQENFRIMRAALDETSERLGRYVMLTNYASGLCMPEIATTAALERLNMLLNDSMYGILFRDINMQRTFVDQHFSRQLNARSGIIINTGEDNYLTTADAVEQAPAVLASQFVNEAFAHRAGLPDRQIGLGDAYEIDPDLKDGFLFQLAQAQLARQIFPDAPLKYMPPTKHMTGNIFKGHLIDAMFNLTSVMTHQTVHLCGMLTEAIHTPFLGDRALSLENARYIMTTARSFGDEIEVKPDGIIERRAQDVLAGAVRLLDVVAERGLMRAIEDGTFADVKRPRDGGRGYDGVFAKDPAYWNPFADALAGEAVAP
ncbi:L-beta-lysine 5,6-aminomutase alpha subunit [Vulcanimicrobium alpinum]|uniref:L-beta-lysine 5,6-aminomutase alpha subunit n=1 Tax=Vulcanimicrobium alpinum TaxID=3016050 RepID=A0AAN1XZ65_UNVUL|nr:lysine 5,6-aminomutase subunit alpha [Vulcanimicrobium alpinum]BDE07644.1 L-beta-lysine 5,6-aminomutase alpha subunit [Vulcanimicrobium alpinum]